MTLDHSITPHPDKRATTLSRISGRVHPSICTAKRHGNWTAYSNGCRCPAARADWTRQKKRVHAGLAQPLLVDATGSVRRLRALAAIGWRTEDIADDTGLSVHTIRYLRRHAWTNINKKMAATVKDCYRRLSVQPGPSQRMRNDAARQGWHPPIDWDRIDDPNEQPAQPETAPQVDNERVVEPDANLASAMIAGRLQWSNLTDDQRYHLIDTLVGRYTLADLADRSGTTRLVLERAVDKRRAQRRRQGLAPLPAAVRHAA